MASTGIANGTLIALYVFVNDVATKVAHLTSNGLSLETALRDSSTKDSEGWEDNLPGRKSWSISADGMFAEDAAYGFTELYDAWNGNEELLIIYSSEVNGDAFYKGLCYITALDRTDPTEENTTFTVSLRGTGPITKFTVS